MSKIREVAWPMTWWPMTRWPMYDAEAYGALAYRLWPPPLAAMIPYNHPNQELLVNFLKVLRGSGNCYCTVGTCSLFLPSHRIIPT